MEWKGWYWQDQWNSWNWWHGNKEGMFTEPLELVEWKEEIAHNDGLVEIDGNFKATGIDRIETV